MEWITPKTDWMAAEDESGNYIGDYFNTEDFNRIKNNIEFLGMVARQFWPVFVRAMPDRKREEYPYADEINTLADNLETINKFVDSDIGEKTVYSENEAFIGFEDLNRLESACLKLYEELCGIYRRPAMLPFRLGAMYFPFKNPVVPQPPRPSTLPFGLGSKLGRAYYPFGLPHTPKREKTLPIKLGAKSSPFNS